MQPLEMIHDAIRVAPNDADRLLCWYINSVRPAKRQSFYERISTAIDTARLTGQLVSPLAVPSLYNEDAAERTWDDLVKRFSLIDGATEHLAPFFRPDPDGLRFAPHAYPGRWAPVTWNVPLTPAEVRDALGINGHYLNELVGIARALVAAEDAVARLPSIFGRNRNTELGKMLLRIAVLPYADTLPMVTMLYAVSDQVEGMGFGLASFYKQRHSESSCIWIGEGSFNAGYATSYGLKELINARFSLAGHRVFHEGFTRSLFLRGLFEGSRAVPQFQHLSFVGQLGPDRICTLDRSLSDQVVAQHAKLNFQDNFAITEYLDPVVNWEIPLVLAFAGGIAGYDKKSVEGLALTVSTDTHLWAASFGLNLKLNVAESELAASTIPTFRRGAWDPSQESGAEKEDKESELKWFVPATDRTLDVMHRLDTIIERFISQKVSEGLEALRYGADAEAMSTAHQKLLPVARSLLAPLLSVFPTYRGPLLATPPEVWMSKLRGPAAYISYRPYWQDQLKEMSGGGHAPEHYRVIEYLKSVA